ncbi:MAG: alginate export family protein [Pseudomonadota bacterium]
MICCTTLVIANAEALTLEDVGTAVSNGSTNINFRYRIEGVDQDGIAESATASTLRSRFTFNTATFEGMTFGMEADYVSLVGAEDYNSTTNGMTMFPVVADPEGFDLNQSFLKIKGKSLTTTFGRQRILHDDQRFVGGVGWRQNEQTYDAIRFEYKADSGLLIDYSYVWNVNRIFGPGDGAQPGDWFGSSHLARAHYKLAKDHTLRGYLYLLDFENANGVPNSTATYGIAYSGPIGPIKLDASLATQSDYGDSPLSYDAEYLSIKGTWKLESLTLTGGLEILGSDGGGASFRTPLATLHKFQGWADKFLGTPANGVEDLYFGISGKIDKVTIAATLHDLTANEGGADYGQEIDIVATWAFAKQMSFQFKIADYSADTLATDTTKTWLTLNARF